MITNAARIKKIMLDLTEVYDHCCDFDNPDEIDTARFMTIVIAEWLKNKIESGINVDFYQKRLEVINGAILELGKLGKL